MKTIKLVIAALALFAVMTVAVSCGGGNSSVSTALDQIEQALEKIEKNKETMTGADWMLLEKELKEPIKVLEDALEHGEINAIQQLKIAATLLRATPTLAEAALYTDAKTKDLVIDGKLLSDSLATIAAQLSDSLGADKAKEIQQELEKAMKQLEKK